MDLLVVDGYWLGHAGFRERCVFTSAGQLGRYSDGDHFAGVDWHVATAVLSEEPDTDTSHARVLCLAMSLAGQEPGFPLADLLDDTLEERMVPHVVAAVARAAGRQGRRPHLGGGSR
jgi:hypothetical protein